MVELAVRYHRLIRQPRDQRHGGRLHSMGGGLVGRGGAQREGAGGPWRRRRRDEEKSHGKNNFDKKRSGGMTNAGAEALTGIKESASGSVPADSPGERRKIRLRGKRLTVHSSAPNQEGTFS